MGLLLRAGAAYLFQDQFKRLNDHIDDNIRSPDKRRPIGSKATLNSKPVYWSGENYGWQSEGSYNKLKEGPEFRAGHIAASRIGTDINQAISTGFNALPEPVKQTTKDVAKAAVDTYQSLPDPVKQGVSSAVDFVGDVNEGISKAANISPIITEEVAQTALTFGAGKIAIAGGKAAVKYDIPSRIYEAQRDIRGMSAVPLGTPGSVGAASALPRPTNWQNRSAALFRAGNKKELAELFWRGQNKPGMKLRQKNMFVTPDELAHNKDGLLQFLIDQADEVQELYPEALTSINKQRRMNDVAANNPFIEGRQIYGDGGTARNYLTRVTNWLSNDEWHHIFGNKEAGEFILSMANSDPVIAVNLFAKMKALNLTSSGIAQNIALMKKYKHTQWHDFIKDMGFEPLSPMKKGKGLTKGSTAPGDFADLSISLSREIVAGRGDINDAFRMLELYAKYNKWVRSKLPDFGAEVISDLPEGVGKALQQGGYYKRPPKPAASKTPLYIK